MSQLREVSKMLLQTDDACCSLIAREQVGEGGYGAVLLGYRKLHPSDNMNKPGSSSKRSSSSTSSRVLKNAKQHADRTLQVRQLADYYKNLLDKQLIKLKKGETADTEDLDEFGCFQFSYRSSDKLGFDSDKLGFERPFERPSLDLGSCPNLLRSNVNLLDSNLGFNSGLQDGSVGVAGLPCCTESTGSMTMEEGIESMAIPLSTGAVACSSELHVVGNSLSSSSNEHVQATNNSTTNTSNTNLYLDNLGGSGNGNLTSRIPFPNCKTNVPNGISTSSGITQGIREIRKAQAQRTRGSVLREMFDRRATTFDYPDENCSDDEDDGLCRASSLLAEPKLLVGSDDKGGDSKGEELNSCPYSESNRNSKISYRDSDCQGIPEIHLHTPDILGIPYEERVDDRHEQQVTDDRYQIVESMELSTDDLTQCITEAGCSGSVSSPTRQSQLLLASSCTKSALSSSCTKPSSASTYAFSSCTKSSSCATTSGTPKQKKSTAMFLDATPNKDVTEQHKHTTPKHRDHGESAGSKMSSTKMTPSKSPHKSPDHTRSPHKVHNHRRKHPRSSSCPPSVQGRTRDNFKKHFRKIAVKVERRPNVTASTRNRTGSVLSDMSTSNQDSSSMSLVSSSSSSKSSVVSCFTNIARMCVQSIFPSSSKRIAFSEKKYCAQTLIQEARNLEVLKKLQKRPHPNLVTFYGFFDFGDERYLAMGLLKYNLRTFFNTVLRESKHRGRSRDDIMDEIFLDSDSDVPIMERRKSRNLGIEDDGIGDGDQNPDVSHTTPELPSRRKSGEGVIKKIPDLNDVVNTAMVAIFGGKKRQFNLKDRKRRKEVKAVIKEVLKKEGCRSPILEETNPCITKEKSKKSASGEKPKLSPNLSAEQKSKPSPCIVEKYLESKNLEKKNRSMKREVVSLVSSEIPISIPPNAAAASHIEVTMFPNVGTTTNVTPKKKVQKKPFGSDLKGKKLEKKREEKEANQKSEPQPYRKDPFTKNHLKRTQNSFFFRPTGSESIVRDLFRQLISGLDWLHSVLKVAHLDLKLENLMLEEVPLPFLENWKIYSHSRTERGPFVLRIIDFGLSICWDSDNATSNASVSGSQNSKENNSITDPFLEANHIPVGARDYRPPELHWKKLREAEAELLKKEREIERAEQEKQQLLQASSLSSIVDAKKQHQETNCDEKTLVDKFDPRLTIKKHPVPKLDLRLIDVWSAGVILFKMLFGDGGGFSENHRTRDIVFFFENTNAEVTMDKIDRIRIKKLRKNKTCMVVNKRSVVKVRDSASGECIELAEFLAYSAIYSKFYTKRENNQQNNCSNRSSSIVLNGRSSFVEESQMASSRGNSFEGITHLLEGMLQEDPQQRMTLEQVRKAKWVNSV